MEFGQSINMMIPLLLTSLQTLVFPSVSSFSFCDLSRTVSQYIVPLMADILHQLMRSSSHYLQGFTHGCFQK